jgi:hypothetical protein
MGWATAVIESTRHRSCKPCQHLRQQAEDRSAVIAEEPKRKRSGDHATHLGLFVRSEVNWELWEQMLGRDPEPAGRAKAPDDL